MLTARFHAALSEGVPTAIHLLPLGKFTATDGRAFSLKDPAAVVAASKADGRQLTIDENHATDYAAKAGFSAPAKGRITDFEVRSDGIWGIVDWNDAGKALLADKAYDSISATIAYAKDGTVLRILRAALTNDPAVPDLKRLFHNQENDMDLAALRAALGLPGTADEAAILAAASAAHQASAATASQLATFAAAAGVAATSTADQIVAAIKGGSGETATLAAKVVNLETELTSIKTASLQREAVAVVDGAIKEGAPIVALRDHYIARFANDPDGVKAELAKLPRINKGTLIPSAQPDPANPLATLSATDRAVTNQMGVDPAKLVAFRKKQADERAA